MIKHLSFVIFLVISSVSSASFAASGDNAVLTTQAAVNQAIAKGLTPTVADKAMHAYYKAAREGVTRSKIFTIIDYTQPSSRKRLWVLDMKRQKVLFNTYVTHGEGSGYRFAEDFSNNNGSHKTSLGMYRTKVHPYVGHFGYALQLDGLEPGINDHALTRAIVFHGAWWADASCIDNNGALPRSYACPTVPPQLVRPIISAIKGGSLLFMYADDRKFINHSHFLA